MAQITNLYPFDLCWRLVCTTDTSERSKLRVNCAEAFVFVGSHSEPTQASDVKDHPNHFYDSRIHGKFFKNKDSKKKFSTLTDSEFKAAFSILQKYPSLSFWARSFPHHTFETTEHKIYRGR